MGNYYLIPTLNSKKCNLFSHLLGLAQFLKISIQLKSNKISSSTSLPMDFLMVLPKNLLSEWTSTPKKISSLMQSTPENKTTGLLTTICLHGPMPNTRESLDTKVKKNLKRTTFIFQLVNLETSTTLIGELKVQ